MKTFLIFIFSISFAKNAEERTQSEKKCVENAQAKNEMIKKSQCKWQVTTQEELGSSGVCKGYDIVGKEKIPKKSTYSSDSNSHTGTLVCNNSENAIATSYKGQLPNFTYQCTECTTSNEGATPDESCMKSMLDSEISQCDGNPRMRYRYDPNKEPVYVDDRGKPIK